MLSTQQAANYGNTSGSGFAAHPRVVNQKQKFKDPYGNYPEEEYVPQNIMQDKRVIRGSTHAAMVIPAGTYPDQLFQGKQTGTKSKKGANTTQRNEKPQGDDYFQRELSTPEPPEGRQNIDIQTDQFVEELTDQAPNYEIGCQTDIVIERPATPQSIPIKRGKDAKTLVEDNDIFIFDKDVEPILSVLCGKTLEFARMEVLEEEELRVMKEQQKHFVDVRNAEVMEADRMEQIELKRKQEFERRKQHAREKKKNQVAAHKKIVTRTIAKKYNYGIKQHVYNYLKDVGYLTNKFKEEVLESNVMPWLQTKVIDFVKEIEELDKFPDNFIVDHLNDFEQQHQETVEAERQRKENVQKELERQEQQRQEEKQKRREAREARRKANELMKLKEEINQSFVQKGEYKENILNQELLEIDGLHQKIPYVGGLGGFLGQVILVFHAIHRTWKKDVNLLDPQLIQNFLYLYVESKMKTEKLTLQVGKAVEDFLAALPQPLKLNEMRVMREPNYGMFRELLSDTNQYGDEILKLMIENSKELGLSKKTYNAVYESFWDLYCKKPQSSELNPKKLDVFIQRVKLVIPPQDTQLSEEEGSEIIPSPIQLPLKAIVRIRIPLKRPQAKNENLEDTQQVDHEQQQQKQENEEGKDAQQEEKKEEGEEADIQSEKIEQLEEQEIEDKVWCLNNIGQEEKIYVLHQAAQRWLRRDIVQQMKKNIEEIDGLDLDEMLDKVEQEANKIENNFFKLFKDTPVFDFEIN